MKKKSIMLRYISPNPVFSHQKGVAQYKDVSFKNSIYGFYYHSFSSDENLLFSLNSTRAYSHKFFEYKFCTHTRKHPIRTLYQINTALLLDDFNTALLLDDFNTALLLDDFRVQV
jgi:hypothetical protein